MFEVAYAQSGATSKIWWREFTFSEAYLVEAGGPPLYISNPPSQADLEGVIASPPLYTPSFTMPSPADSGLPIGANWTATGIDFIPTIYPLKSGYPKLDPPQPFVGASEAAGPHSNGKWTIVLFWKLKVVWEYGL